MTYKFEAPVSIESAMWVVVANASNVVSATVNNLSSGKLDFFQPDDCFFQ